MLSNAFLSLIFSQKHRITGNLIDKNEVVEDKFFVGKDWLVKYHKNKKDGFNSISNGFANDCGSEAVYISKGIIMVILSMPSNIFLSSIFSQKHQITYNLMAQNDVVEDKYVLGKE